MVTENKKKEVVKSKFDDTAGKLKGKKAKKKHHILQNHINIQIKEGQDLEKIPDRFEDALKSEGVI